MKLRVTFLVVLLVASLFAAVFTLSDVHAQQPQYGPNIDHILFGAINVEPAAIYEMKRRGIDILTGLRYPWEIAVVSHPTLPPRKILSMSDDNFYYVGFNVRPYRSGVSPKALPFGPQGGGEPGRSLRHAIAHLIPKTILIYNLFGYVCTQIEVPMSTSLGTFGADIDTHPYNPAMATDILLAAGWTWDGSDWHVPATVPGDYPLPGGNVLPIIEFMSQTPWASGSSWVIVDEIARNMRNIGIRVDHTEYDLTTMINMIDAGDFEMYFFYEEDMGRFGDHLYDFFHSANDILGGYNRPGLHNDTLDAVLWDMYTTLDKAYMEDKVAEALELLMGTSAYQNTLLTDGIVSWIPLYSRIHYDAYDERLCGIVNAKLKGSWNYWTACNLDWNPMQAYSRPSDLIPPLPTGSTAVIFCWRDDPQYPANPAWVSSTVTWDMLDHIYEGLIGMNPYNLKDKQGWLDLTRDPDPNTTPGWTIIPWTVTDGPAAGEDGMKVTFYLDNTVARPWHDGHNWDAYDVAFAWEYLTVNKIPRAWNTFEYFHHCTIEDPYTITAYMTTTGITLPYSLSEWSSMFPEHVWGCTHSRGGRATASCVSGTAHERTNAWNSMVSHINSGAVQGTAGNKLATDPDATAESGLCLCGIGTQDAGGKLTCEHGSGCVLDDWDTAENEILDYDPAAYAWPTAAYPWLTEQIGTGPFVFYQINETLPPRGDLIAFDTRTQTAPTPGVNYPKTTNEIHTEMVEMFWECGDVDLNGKIRVVYDLATIGAYFMMPVPPAPWRADVYRDNIIDIRDMSIAGRNLGAEREVDP